MEPKTRRLLASVGVIAATAAALELLVLPFLYRDVPVPFERTGKPIGAALFSVTFFHLLVISGSLFAFALIADRLGYRVPIVPKSRNDWIDLAMLIVLLGSGLGVWFSPFFLASLAVAGTYFAFVDLK